MTEISSAIADIPFKGRAPIDALLATVVGRLRQGGVRVAGFLQEDDSGIDGTDACGSMRLRDLDNGAVHGISQDLGRFSTGCRLDSAALTEAAGLLEAAIDAGAELVVVNRFGKAEADGSGLRLVIARAMAAGIPVLVPVREDYAPAWADFHGGMADSLPAEAEAVLDWCHRALRRHSLPFPDSAAVPR
ncbi:MAG: DUF2478 domain-containing protein [Oceanibaculum nanhaiense]|jgi:hypothetical protein|uniref:DUF2478 domain-containing protein n=1 Tax=Oceanibaculum nanhaiense TaxID=1909734 RepID=UPI0032EC1BF0